MLRFLLPIAVLFSTCSGVLGQSSPNLLTSKTKGYFCILNVQDFQARWEKTELGQLASDPIMEPFTNDLKAQIRERLIESNLNVSIEWADVREVCQQELCIAAIVPEDGEGFASVLILDIGGNEAQAQQLIDRISKDLQKRNAKKQVTKILGHDFVIHELPREKGQLEADRVIRFMIGNLLVIGNHEKVSESLAKRIINKDFSDSLASTLEFQRTVTRCAQMDENISEQLQWYVEPFGFVRLLREARNEKRGRGRDMLAVFKSQGFDAIRGLGGVTSIKTNEHELLHRIFLYAPKVEGADEGQMYKLAARMLTFPNGDDWQLPGWLPRDLASFAWVRWKTKDAFNYSASLVDAIADSPIFDQVLEDLEKDPNGPKVNLRKGLIDYFGDDVLILTDQELPVTLTSERAVVAIPVSDEKAVEKTLHKLFDDDPTAQVQQIQGKAVWELRDDEVDESLPAIPVPVLGPDAPVAQPNKKNEDEEVILTDYTITVAHKHLLVASHISLMKILLTKRKHADSLAGCGDYQLVTRHLEQIGAGADSCRFFARTDEAYRTNYELIRQGKMPESKTMLGKVLNRLLGDPKREVLREQKLSGNNLPPFQAVRRYLGPAGLYSRTTANGWEIGGLLLQKRKVDRAAVTAR